MLKIRSSIHFFPKVLRNINSYSIKRQVLKRAQIEIHRLPSKVSSRTWGFWQTLTTLSARFPRTSAGWHMNWNKSIVWLHRGLSSRWIQTISSTTIILKLSDRYTNTALVVTAKSIWKLAMPSNSYTTCLNIWIQVKYKIICSMASKTELTCVQIKVDCFHRTRPFKTIETLFDSLTIIQFFSVFFTTKYLLVVLNFLQSLHVQFYLILNIQLSKLFQLRSGVNVMCVHSWYDSTIGI